MNPDALDQYQRAMTELLILREAEGGELPVEVESAYVERLDALWWRLSEAEQADFEAEFANALPPGTPERLDLVDCLVTEGDRSGPRRAA